MARASPAGSRHRGAAAVRSVVLYVALVGTPFLGLLWILGMGDRLAPPPRFGGGWRLEGPPAEAPGSDCPGQDLSPGTGLEISQSGLWAVLVFHDARRTTVHARLEDTLLVGRLPSAPGSRCRGEATLRLGLARGGEESLTGDLTVPDCAACRPVPFRAVRRPAAREP